MEEQSQHQQEKDSTTLPDDIDESGGGKDSCAVEESGGNTESGVSSQNIPLPTRSTDESSINPGKSLNLTEEKICSVEKEVDSEKGSKDDGSDPTDCTRSCASSDPRPNTGPKDASDKSGKEQESFPSLFISHASINISGSNPDISESERLKRNSREKNIGESCRVSKTDLDGAPPPQRVVVHRVCSDSRIGEGEGFHSSKLAFYTADGSLSNSLKALGLSFNGKGGSRSGSIKATGKRKEKEESCGSGGGATGSELEKCEDSGKVNKSTVGSGNSIKARNEAVNVVTEARVAVSGSSGIGESSIPRERRSSGSSSGNNNNSNKQGIEILPTIEQSLSEHTRTEHPSTSEGEETLTEDVVDEDEELLDEYDEPNENLDCQLDFDAAVTELLLRPERDDPNSYYKDSATWTAEDDMPSPLSDFSPVASPRRKRERHNIYRELDREAATATSPSGNSHNSLLEQYHQYLQEQQQQHTQKQSHSRQGGGNRGGSGGRGSGGSIPGQHHSHNPNSSIVGIHKGNLKSQSQSHHHSRNSHSPLPPPPPPHHQPTECFTVSSQLLSREAKLYENVPATQGELETLEILLASGGSGDSNYPPSGGSGSGGGASNTTASTSNTSGTSGQSRNHKISSTQGANLNNNNQSNSHHRSHHHRSNQHQPAHHSQQQAQSSHHQTHHHHHLLPQGYVHSQHSHSATNLNQGNSSEQLFSVSDFLGPGGALTVSGNNNGGPPSRTSWADSGRESLSFDGENNNSTGSTRNLLLIPPPPPPPINYLANTSSVAGHTSFGGNGGGGSSVIMHSSHHSQHHSKHSSGHHHHHREHHHHHHTHSQITTDSPSHTSHQSHRDTRRSRRERLVRQKHTVNDETLYQHNNPGEKTFTGMVESGTSFMAMPSPRRCGTSGNVLPGGMQASNFVAAAASPINLQRHPPASQIMLQENKKNGALIACESPYGIMAGGNNTGATEWAYPETFGDNYRRPTHKSHLTSNILRSRSPQRGRGIVGGVGGKGNNNSSFDYGELPSHQMFPKRHLLTSRQFSGHRGYSAGNGGTMQNSMGVSNAGNGTSGNSVCPPTGFQPMQHRSFPAGVFSGATPRSCSMGDLTSSAASLNGQGHQHSNHHGGKSPERMAISCNTAPVNGLQSSTVPLVTSLPLPPATSVTYEFSLAPVSGTLAPGWHLTAVQRGLATAVPLAAAVARRRLPRPRTTRPRFGFTDKNEARRAKWTIVVTALALLAMSMLLVGVTLRLAPLIDDLGSTSSSLAKKRTLSYREPLSRRASGDAVPTSKLSPATYHSLLHPLKAKQFCRHRVADCTTCSREIDSENENDFLPKHSCKVNFKQKRSEASSPSVSFSPPGESGQYLSTGSSIFSLLPDPFEKRKQVGFLSKDQTCGHNSESGQASRITRQLSMTLSIPSRENSLRSCTSSPSYGSYSEMPSLATVRTLMPIPGPSRPISNPIGTTSKVVAKRAKSSLQSCKLVKSGSNPDLRSSSQTRQSEQIYKLQPKFERSVSTGRSPVGSVEAISARGRHSKDNSTFSLAEKKKQILSQKQKRNEKVAWAVHLGFSVLLILAITCIVVFLRLSSTMSVRKENEHLMHRIQPQLINNNTSSTPPPATNTHQVNDNSNGSAEESSSDKGIGTKHLSGKSLEDLKLSAFSSERSFSVDSQLGSNNETHENLRSEHGEELTFDRSNNSNNINSSYSSTSMKTSRPKRYSSLGNALKGKSHTNLITESSSKKARHLERTLMRFIKSGYNGGSTAVRKRRYIDLKARIL